MSLFGAELDPMTGKCKPNGAAINMTNCSWDNTAGASKLKTLWIDSYYNSNEDAFYYVRVVQNQRVAGQTMTVFGLGREVLDDSPATVTEMAWSSPIWVKANAK